MAARIKMSLGMELALSPGDFALDGDVPGWRDFAHAQRALFLAQGHTLFCEITPF